MKQSYKYLSLILIYGAEPTETIQDLEAAPITETEEPNQEVQIKNDTGDGATRVQRYCSSCANRVFSRDAVV